MKLLLGLLLATSPVLAAGGDDWDPALMYEATGMEPEGAPVTDAELLDARVQDITAGLRCPVCQGMSVADSNTEAALNMKARVSELVAQGYSDVQIEDYFVVRYSTWILLEPPKEGLNWLVWAGPLGVAGLGLLGVGAFWMRRRQDETSPPPQEPESSEDPYEQRILEELNR